MEMSRAHAKIKTLHSNLFSKTNDSTQIDACTKEYLCDIIFSSPVARTLFPDGVILSELFPIEPLRSNIDYLQQECDLYFAVEKRGEHPFPRSVSFGVLSPRARCMVWTATVYTSDPALYKEHVLYQFKRACDVVDDDFIFQSIQDKGLTSHGRRVLQERLQVQLEEETSPEVNETILQ